MKFYDPPKISVYDLNGTKIPLSDSQLLQINAL
jgi:hypothetical protein